jgi:hypothetical protein
MSFYGFENPDGFYKAQRFLGSFRNYPAREHPGFLSVYDGEPSLKSTTEWLVSAGYKGLEEFAEWYELDEGPATKLLQAFKDNHLMAWLEMRRKVKEKPQEDLKKWKAEVEKKNGVGATRAWEKVAKMTRAEVGEAVQWNEKQDHMGCQDLKDMAVAGVVHGMPDSLKKIRVDDIPACKYCTACGMKDR